MMSLGSHGTWSLLIQPHTQLTLIRCSPAKSGSLPGASTYRHRMLTQTHGIRQGHRDPTAADQQGWLTSVILFFLLVRV